MVHGRALVSNGGDMHLLRAANIVLSLLGTPRFQFCPPLQRGQGRIFGHISSSYVPSKG